MTSDRVVGFKGVVPHHVHCVVDQDDVHDEDREVDGDGRGPVSVATGEGGGECCFQGRPCAGPFFSSSGVRQEERERGGETCSGSM